MNLDGRSVLFVCPSRASFGEAHNATRAALSLQAELGAEVAVIARDTHSRRLANLGVNSVEVPIRAADGRQWLQDAISSIAPDLIVVADHENCAIERTPFDNGTIYDSGVPVVVFDSLQLSGRTKPLKCAIATVSGAKALRRWWPPDTVVPEVPASVPVLTPVPVASTSTAVRPFAVYHSAPQSSIAPEKVRSMLGVGNGERLVVLAQSAWAIGAYHQLSRGRSSQERYGSIRARRLTRAFARVDLPMKILDVSVPQSSPHSLSSVATEFDWTLPTAFTSLLAAADLFVTDNLVSGAAAQAALLGTAILCLVNSSHYEGVPGDPLDEAMNRNFAGWGFPYLVNPFGWHEELAELRRGNAYVSAIPLAEAYDSEDVVAALARQLHEDRDLAPTTVLAELLPRLPSPASALADAVRPL